jgi:hypothetical protein
MHHMVCHVKKLFENYVDTENLAGLIHWWVLWCRLGLNEIIFNFTSICEEQMD